MDCPKCQFENRKEAKFCLQCGEKLELNCPQCGKELPLLAKFCDGCGQRLDEVVETEEIAPEIEGERKHVTVLFSDLSGYTAMSEKLDPEEVKEITSRIFSEISQVIDKYEGFVEKFVGDAVMALLGVPKAHEDDPIRAIRVAREIHELVDALSPEIEKRIGQPISMHTGINTGLVVTGEVDMEKGTHGVAGDTINLASRLCSLGKAGEILVGPDTHRQAEGHFGFETLQPKAVKGKAEPVQVYRVLSPKERPVTVHRLSGLRADLIGRKAEIAQLAEAVDGLRAGKGRIFSICGDAGTGKSRLVEEFKATLDFEEIQWLEGHAYAYAQNIPYFPLIDLLNGVLQIEEGDPPEKVREKVESGVEDLVGKKEDVVPYIGTLYSISYPEIEEVSPEFWKSRLQDAMQMTLTALARRAPTIFFLEDLHWADPSFVDLLRYAFLEVQQPAIVLCVYRPTFSLFTSHQLSGIGKIYHEIRLQELSLSDAQDMLESLLKTERIPSDLKRLVQSKAEGNPFYLEELVNSLIESEILIRDNGNWKITKPITESEISSTIHGLISGRLDRLEKQTKRILQEASVIGRAFLYDILRRITELEDRIDRGLSTLERLDLIRARSLQPDLEYMFKHPLTQEVVYNGLLKKERQVIHEQVALVMEQLFQERLPEFYETLAFHFKQGRSIHRAVDYLMKSGEKNLKRYAVEESHQYYKEAFDLLSAKPGKSKEEEELLIDLLIKWAFVFYYLGDFKGLTDLLSDHKTLAESLDDKARLGMFYAWLGFAVWMNGRAKDSYPYLCKALELGEKIDNKPLIGYACTWLTWNCWDLGMMDKAITFGERAQKMCKFVTSDHYLFLKSLAGIGQTSFFKGDRKRLLAAGEALLDYGRKHSNIRSMVVGHVCTGFGHFMASDFISAIESYRSAIQISADPFYTEYPRCFLGVTYFVNGQYQEAEEALKKNVTFCQEFGADCMGLFTYAYQGALYILKGHMSQGLKMIEEARQSCIENERMTVVASIEYLLGRVYFLLAQRAGPTSLSIMAKNIGFLVRNVPFASRKAEDHFNRTIEISKKIGAKPVLGSAYLDLGLLHRVKGKKDQARVCISNAIEIFEQCEAEEYLKQAKDALASL
jgi:class 3 adenylate cyclase/tetratricopeptide (TPR) repeat protein